MRRLLFAGIGLVLLLAVIVFYVLPASTGAAFTRQLRNLDTTGMDSLVCSETTQDIFEVIAPVGATPAAEDLLNRITGTIPPELRQGIILEIDHAWYDPLSQRYLFEMALGVNLPVSIRIEADIALVMQPLQRCVDEISLQS